MLKMKTKGKDGRPLYVVGLSPMNMKILRGGDPISFDGASIMAPPGHWFLFAYVRDAADLKRHHDHFSVPEKYNHTIGIDASVWERLSKGEIITFPGGPMKLDGDLLLICGVEEHEIAKTLGIDEAVPVKSGYEDVLDPVTGRVVRKPVGKSS